MEKEIKIYDMDELLTVIEGMNKALIGVESDVTVVFGARPEEIEKIAKQQGESFFKPTFNIPHYWAIMKLGVIEVTFRSRDLQRKFI